MVKMWLLVKSVLVEMKEQHLFRFAKASNNNVTMNIVSTLSQQEILCGPHVYSVIIPK